MYLLIKDNPEKAKQILKTNRELKIGDKLQGEETQLKYFAVKYNDVFEIGGIEKVEAVQKNFSPKKDKKLRKGNKFKSKD